jgi:hypothetical protein
MCCKGKDEMRRSWTLEGGRSGRPKAKDADAEPEG